MIIQPEDNTLHQVSMKVTLSCILLFYLASSTSYGDDGSTTTPLPLLPNVAYLGYSYDAFKANPRPTDANFVSLGYRQSAIQTDSSNLAQVLDGKFAAPSNVNVLAAPVCSRQYDWTVIFDYNSYRQSRSWQVDVSDGISVPFLFGVSDDFRDMSTKFSQTSSASAQRYVEAWTDCSTYFAEFVQDDFNVSSGFRAAVADLGTPASYQNFVQTFGTHVITAVTMGSLNWARFSFSSNAWSTLSGSSTSQGGSKDVSGAVLLLMMNLGVSVNAAQQSQSAQNFQTAAEKGQYFSLGNDTFPMPISVQLAPLSILFDAKYFPSDPNISAKQIAFERALAKYCSQLASTSILSGITGSCLNADQIANVTLQNGSILGGIYAESSSNGLVSVSNYITGDFDCPDGFQQVVTVGNLNRTKVQLCLSSTSTHSHDFGGMFQIASFNVNGTMHYLQSPWTCSNLDLGLCQVTTKQNEGFSCSTSNSWPQSIINPLTQDNSCPASNSAVLLWRQTDIPVYSCSNNCAGFMVFIDELFTPRPKCDTKCHGLGEATCSVYATVEIFACYDAASSLIGGFFSPNEASTNPATGAYSCPVGFAPVSFLEDSFICLKL